MAVLSPQKKYHIEDKSNLLKMRLKDLILNIFFRHVNTFP